jgi:hypothetical protein
MNNSNIFTMVVRHGVGKDIKGYTLIDSEYRTVMLDSKTLANKITSKAINVTNMAVENGKLISTNGALDKYTLVNTDTNAIEGTPRAVILNRVEQNDKLIGYTVFSNNGSIVEMSVADAVTLCNSKALSNGKIRHTETGDIVSSITGNYPLRTIEVKQAPKGETTVDILYFATAANVDVEYFGAIVSGTSAAELSRLGNILTKSNATLIANVVKKAGNDVRKSLAMTRVGANGIYGVFELKMLDELIKAGAKIKLVNSKAQVSSVYYSDGGIIDEATVTLDKNSKIVGKNSATGTKASTVNNKVKEYTKKISSKLNSIKLEHA